MMNPESHETLVLDPNNPDTCTRDHSVVNDIDHRE